MTAPWADINKWQVIEKCAKEFPGGVGKVNRPKLDQTNKQRESKLLGAAANAAFGAGCCKVAAGEYSLI